MISKFMKCAYITHYDIVEGSILYIKKVRLIYFHKKGQGGGKFVQGANLCESG